ncbi:MAG: hypothetical protein JW827_11335 [Spirochaetes bacterium]|nr:hypothetical protein [Spirochaetota bacterium]
MIKIVKNIKKISPYTNIHTHFIYGFPSETRNEFLDSVNLTRFFNRATFFLYSKRKDTPAAELKGKISSREIEYRTNYLRKLRRRSSENIFWKRSNGQASDRSSREQEGSLI